MDQRLLDELVDQVAARTGRNVTLDDVYGRVLASNTSRPTTDRARIDAVMLKVVPDDVRAWEVETGAASSQRPFVQPPSPERGYLSRLCIPLVFRGVRIGYFWVLAADDDDDLGRMHASITRDQATVENLAERVASALQGDDDEVRIQNDAFRKALLGGGHVPGVDRFARDARLVVTVVGLAALADAEPASVPLLAWHAASDATRALRLTTSVLVEPDHVVFVTVAPVDVAALVARFESSARQRRPRDRAQRIIGPFGSSQPLRADTGHEISIGYGQAMVALQASSVDPALVAHTYGDAGIYQFVSQTRVPSIGDTVLDRLVAAPGGVDHLALLECLYDSDAPMRTIADELHLHRTSLYNRLQRIAKVIDADPLSSRVRQQLHLGAKLRRWENRPRFALHDQWVRTWTLPDLVTGESSSLKGGGRHVSAVLEDDAGASGGNGGVA